MLARFGMQNFLSYANLDPIPLGRLNVFVGKNNSGKSAILHALALLSETVADPSPSTSLLLSGNGLNLGTYRDVVHKNNDRSAMAIDLELTPQTRGASHLWPGQRIPRSRTPVRYHVTFRRDKASLTPYVSAASVFTKAGDRCFTLQGQPGRSCPGYQRSGAGGYGIKPAGVVPEWRHFLPVFRDSGRSRTNATLKSKAPFLAVSRTSYELEYLLRNLVYIGPSRAPLDAVYFSSGGYPTKMDSAGSNAVPLILGGTRAVLNRNRFYKVLNEWLGKRFGLVSASQLRPLKETQGVRLEGTDPLIDATVVLSNTGYGVSQILPIVIQLALGKPCILLIEQPEIHLHPAAQAELANLLVEFAKNNYQVLVETHSEHLIMRLRALLARDEADLDARDVRLFHVEKTRSGSRLNRIEVTKTGSLKGWPRGFFSGSADDLLDVMGGGRNGRP